MAGLARVRLRWAVLYLPLTQRGAGRDSVLNILMSLYLDANPAFGHLGVYRNGEVGFLLSLLAYCYHHDGSGVNQRCLLVFRSFRGGTRGIQSPAVHNACSSTGLPDASLKPVGSEGPSGSQ